MDRFASLQAFHRVVDEGGFAAAARSLRLSPAMVSKHVKDLEAQLGVRLLQRTTRRVALTDIGTVFYERSCRVLADLAAAERMASTSQDEPAGLLRVAAPAQFGELHFASALPDFAARHPRIRLEISCDDKVIDLVEGRFDAALRIGKLPDSSLVARKLAPISVLVCAAPAYLAEHGVPASPEALLHHPCLQYDYQWAGRGWDLRLDDGASSTAVRLGDSPYRSNNGEILRQFAIAGHGLAQLPDFMVVQDIIAGRLVEVLDRYRPEDRWVHAVVPPGHHLSATVRAFIDFFADRFGGTPPWTLAPKT
jgi:DNA-binding transcriptional LysR family regulator